MNATHALTVPRRGVGKQQTEPMFMMHFGDDYIKQMLMFSKQLTYS